MEEKLLYQEIFRTAEDLANLINIHPLYTEYQEVLKAINENRDAQNLLKELVEIGRSLSQKAEDGEDIKIDETEKNKNLEEGLNKFPIVKEFIGLQKNYLVFMKNVQQKIFPIQNE